MLAVENYASFKSQKLEQFRNSIRKQKLENIFKAKRKVFKLSSNHTHSTSSPTHLLHAFLTSRASLDEFCDAVDSSDNIDLCYYEMANKIIEIKQFLLQDEVLPTHFRLLLKLLNNIMIVQPLSIKKLLYGPDGRLDPQLILRIQALFSQPQFLPAHNDLIFALILLIENDKETLKMVQQSPTLYDSIIYSSYDRRLDFESLERLSEFVFLTYRKFKSQTIPDLYEMTREMLRLSLRYQAIDVTYGILLLSDSLRECQRVLIYENEGLAIINNFFSAKPQTDMLSNYTLVRILNKVVRQCPDHILLLCMRFVFCEFLVDCLKMNESQITNQCLKLIKFMYANFPYPTVQLEDAVLEAAEDQLKDNADKFLGFIYNNYGSADQFCLVKAAEGIIEFKKFLGTVEEKCLQEYVQFLSELITSQNPDLQLRVIQAANQLVSMRDLADQLVLLGVIAKSQQFINKVSDLALDENRDVARNAEELMILLQV